MTTIEQKVEMLRMGLIALKEQMIDLSANIREVNKRLKRLEDEQ